MTRKQCRLATVATSVLIIGTALIAPISASLRAPDPEPTYTVSEMPSRLDEPQTKTLPVQPISKAHTAEPSEPEEVTPEPELVSLGDFTLTAYCSCEICCGEWALNRPNGIVYTATGTEAVAGRTIAVDPDVIPYGSTVYINGQAYVAEDCGGAIQGNRIDVYFDSHSAALEFGVQYAEIFMEGAEK